MKLIIKFFVVTLLLLTTAESMQAQAHRRRAFYGDFFAGLTSSTMELDGANAYKSGKIGFQMGGNFNYRFFRNMQLQTGFYLIKKGLERKETPEEPMPGGGVLIIRDMKNTIDANYIQIPFNIGFEVPMLAYEGLYLSFHAGVFGAYGFTGDSKRKGYEARCTEDGDGNRGELYNFTYPSENIKTFSDNALKKWDYGLNGNVALVYDIFILQFQYDHGLADIATESMKVEWGNRWIETYFDENGSLVQATNTRPKKWMTRNYSLSFGFRF